MQTLPDGPKLLSPYLEFNSLIANLVTSWHHSQIATWQNLHYLHCLRLPNCLQHLALSWYLRQPESQVSIPET